MGTFHTIEQLRQMETLHPGDTRWQLVVRVAASTHFRRAPRLREFLTYVCDRALRGDVDSLSEHQIGHAVFERGDDYSPTEDNVVRAHARQVRVKLSEYFLTTGKDEPVTIEIPKGSYVPVFAERPVATPFIAQVAPSEPTPIQMPPDRHPWPLIVATGCALTALAMSAYLWMENRDLRTHAAALSSVAETPAAPLSWLFQDRQPITVIVADSAFGLLQDLQSRTASLDEYVQPGFFARHEPSTSKEARAFLQRLGSRQLTSYADLVLSEKIVQLAGPRAPGTVAVRFARDVRLRDFSSGNFILLGSAYSNPWVSLFSKRRDFVIDLDSATRKGTVLNRSPQPGEKPSYVMTGEDGIPGRTYGVIAFLPADSESGNVLMIEGTNMEGTEAAGDYLTNPQKSERLAAALGLKQPYPTKRYFELLLETRAVGGSSRDTSVVAARK